MTSHCRGAHACESIYNFAIFLTQFLYFENKFLLFLSSVSLKSKRSRLAVFRWEFGTSQSGPNRVIGY